MNKDYEIHNIIHQSEKFRWSYVPADPEIVSVIGNFYDFPRPIAEIMAKKGFSGHSELNAFFEMPLSALLNPFEMLDMEKGVSRICDAVIKRQRICIYGDYDVDGITSTSIMYLFLKQIGADVIYYIPNRLEEGYGLNSEAIKEIASKNVKVIITVDCGISAIKETAEASAIGIDVIITDHHQPASEIPSAYAVINPMREGDPYPYKTLAGVGISFKVIMALRHALRKRGFFKGEAPNIKNFLDIVTLGTIADVVPITQENRIIVKQGLKIMSAPGLRVGIEELKNTAGLNNQAMKTYHVGFQLAPRLNAVGRMGSSGKSLELLITSDRNEAKKLALELDNENKFRQAIERDILQETFSIIEKENMGSSHGIVLAGENWHPGVIGIVASRVVDKYFRPAIILSCDGETAKGSARSIPSFHLYEGLAELSDMLLSFGGHKYAAGMKINKNRTEELRERFNKIVAEKLTEEDFIPVIQIDSIIDSQDINEEMIEWLSKLEPFGSGNKEPVFCLENVSKYQSPSLVGKDACHLKCCFEKNGTVFDSIGYNMKNYKNLINECDKFDILFTLTVSKWKGARNIQLNLKDIKKAG